MSNVLINSSTTTLKSRSTNVWGSKPPFVYESAFSDGAVGQTITDFPTPFAIEYSNDIAGVDGGTQVAKLSPAFEAKYFGGKIMNCDYSSGDDIWVSWYQYFPTGFIFANGINGDANGGAAAIKWLRLQFEGTSERITLGVHATGGWTGGAALTEMQYDWVIGEAMDWVNRHGSQANFFDTETTPKIPLQQWHQVQMHVHLSAGDSVNADGDGFIRTWVDDTYLGQINHNTMPISGTSNLKSIWMGDYWNGGAPQTQSWYVDRVRIADSAPSTLDAGGRPYIATVGS